MQGGGRLGPALGPPQDSKMIFILLFLLNLTVQQTIASEAFIKVTKFPVPTQVRAGDTFRLACYYELSKEQRLYAMKLFKDGSEFYRFSPSDNTRQAFRVAGLAIEFVPQKPLEVLVRNAEAQTAGRYKCMITVEGTFKSISQERDLKVVNRSQSVQFDPSVSEAVVGGSLMGGSLANRQQQQRHAVQMKKQQQKYGIARGNQSPQSSSPPAQEGQQRVSASSSAINCSPFGDPASGAVYTATLMMISLLVHQLAGPPLQLAHRIPWTTSP